MKVALSIGCLAILCASRQKDLSVKEDAKEAWWYRLTQEERYQVCS